MVNAWHTTKQHKLRLDDLCMQQLLVKHLLGTQHTIGHSYAPLLSLMARRWQVRTDHTAGDTKITTPVITWTQRHQSFYTGSQKVSRENLRGKTLGSLFDPAPSTQKGREGRGAYALQRPRAGCLFRLEPRQSTRTRR